MPIRKANKYKKRSLNEEKNHHHMVFKRDALDYSKGFSQNMPDFMKINEIHKSINSQEKKYIF